MALGGGAAMMVFQAAVLCHAVLLLPPPRHGQRAVVCVPHAVVVRCAWCTVGNARGGFKRAHMPPGLLPSAVAAGPSSQHSG